MLNSWNMSHLFYSGKILFHSVYALKIFREDLCETFKGQELISGLWPHNFVETVSCPFSGGQPHGINDYFSIFLYNMLSIPLSDGTHHFLCVVNVRVQGSVFDCTWIPLLRDSFLSRQDWDACFLLCSVLVPDSWSKGCAYLDRKREAGQEIGNIPSLLPSTPFLLLTCVERSAEWGSPWERVAEWWGDELQTALKVACVFLLGDSNNAIINQNATDWKQNKKWWLVTAQRLVFIKYTVKMLVSSWTISFGKCQAFCFVLQIKCRDSNAKGKKKFEESFSELAAACG